MKRAFDFFVAFTLLALIFVPMVLIALAVVLTSKGPAFYWSQRLGKDRVPFLMPKFRTMRVNSPVLPTERLAQPDQYITKVGKFLRRTSIDELPQLYSVVVGNMSLVGPRPVLPSQRTLIASREVAGIYQLRPGITGWAQINGRDDINEIEKVKLDLEYLERQSFGFDILILWRTVFYVLGSKGVWH